MEVEETFTNTFVEQRLQPDSPIGRAKESIMQL